MFWCRLHPLPAELAGGETILARVLGETLSGRHAGCHRGLEASSSFSIGPPDQIWLFSPEFGLRSMLLGARTPRLFKCHTAGLLEAL